MQIPLNIGPKNKALSSYFRSPDQSFRKNSTWWFKCLCWSFLLLLGLIGKHQTSSGDKELSGLTLRDLWENSSNTVNKPLAPIGGGLSVTRAKAGED